MNVNTAEVKDSLSFSREGRQISVILWFCIADLVVGSRYSCGCHSKSLENICISKIELLWEYLYAYRDQLIIYHNSFWQSED